jgi:hypothetical protein
LPPSQLSAVSSTGDGGKPKTHPNHLAAHSNSLHQNPHHRSNNNKNHLYLETKLETIRRTRPGRSKKKNEEHRKRKLLLQARRLASAAAIIKLNKMEIVESLSQQLY